VTHIGKIPSDVGVKAVCVRRVMGQLTECPALIEQLKVVGMLWVMENEKLALTHPAMLDVRVLQ